MYINMFMRLDDFEKITNVITHKSH